MSLKLLLKQKKDLNSKWHWSQNQFRCKFTCWFSKTIWQTPKNVLLGCQKYKYTKNSWVTWTVMMNTENLQGHQAKLQGEANYLIMLTLAFNRFLANITISLHPVHFTALIRRMCPRCLLIFKNYFLSHLRRPRSNGRVSYAVFEC